MPRFRSISTAVLAVLPALPLSASVGHPAPVPTGAHAPQPDRRASLADQTWDLAVTRHFGHPGSAAGYSTILLAGRDLWAFGGTNPGGRSTPIADRLTGGKWAASALPTGLSDFISDASAPSRADIWAVSSYGRFVLRWDGARWHLVRQWRGPGFLTDIVATSPHDAWVFGTAFDGSRSLGTWHYDGHRWLRVTGAARDIYRASVVSGRDIWAIAAEGRTDSILRSDGRRWHRVRTDRAVSAVRWRDVLAESPRNVWLLGNTANGRLVLAHWTGSSWHLVTTPLKALAGQLARGANGRVLATATTYTQNPAGLVIEVTDAGRLTSSAITSPLGCGVSDAVLVPRTGSVWATGGTLTRLGGNAAIWVRAPAAVREHGRDEI